MAKKKQATINTLSKTFTLTADYHAKCFAVAEQIISSYNLLMGAYFAYQTWFVLKHIKPSEELLVDYDNDGEFQAMNLTQGAITIEAWSNGLAAGGLITQAILGLFLYSSGYMEKSTVYCSFWIAVAIFNLFNFVQIELIRVGNYDTSVEIDYDVMASSVYLTYNIVGVVAMFNYMRILRLNKLLAEDPVEILEEVPPVAMVIEAEESSDWERGSERSYQTQSSKRPPSPAPAPLPPLPPPLPAPHHPEIHDHRGPHHEHEHHEGHEHEHEHHNPRSSAGSLVVSHHPHEASKKGKRKPPASHRGGMARHH